MNICLDNYLNGKCLIASPNMEDERFANTLIYICSHTASGAMGFVINKKFEEFSFKDLARQLTIPTLCPVAPIDIHQGGPLETIRGFVIHSSEYMQKDSIKVSSDVAISSSIEVISDIANGIGPSQNIIALGYSCWKAQQLEQEIIRNDWLVVEPSNELVFKTKDEEKWEKALDSLGIDINRLSLYSGRA